MTPAARIAASIEILDEIARGDAPADAVLADWFRGHRFAGSGDRRAIRETVYRDLRQGALLRWAVADWDGEVPRNRILAHLAINAPDDIDGLFDGRGYGPGVLNEDERALVASVRGLDMGKAPQWVVGNCPEHLAFLFDDQWGEDAGAELAALNETAPVDLRVNTLRATRDAARERLRADGYESAPTMFSAVGLRGTERGDFDRLGAYREGLVEPQDESSQLVAMLVGAEPEMRVVDFCAGAGGKALALAAASGNRAEIVACDISASRLSRMAPRGQRLGVENLRTLELDADQVPDELRGWADRVLVDAPCSGTGTWRRSPDLRWRTTRETIAEYARTQDALLDRAAGIVRPGGRLIYAVCSVLDAEGPDRVDAFLARNPAFERVPVSEVLGTDLVGRLGCGVDLVLTPRRHGTDGMYAAVLGRVS